MPEPHDGAEWDEPERVAAFTARVTPGRPAEEAALVELVPTGQPLRVLDLGTGDGRLLRVVASHAPIERGVGLDSSPEMLARAAALPETPTSWTFLQHDLTRPLPELGDFDVVVSGLAIRHLCDARKRALVEEVRERLAPGRLFANLDIVKLGTPALDRAFLQAIGRHDGGDPSDRPSPVAEQLGWLQDAGSRTSTATGSGGGSRCSWVGRRRAEGGRPADGGRRPDGRRASGLGTPRGR
jgi:SAM-dependent methyltransferase